MISISYKKRAQLAVQEADVAGGAGVATSDITETNCLACFKHCTPCRRIEVKHAIDDAVDQ